MIFLPEWVPDPDEPGTYKPLPWDNPASNPYEDFKTAIRLLDEEIKRGPRVEPMILGPRTLDYIRSVLGREPMNDADIFQALWPKEL